jgi:predicted double-glycine peptidase
VSMHRLAASGALITIVLAAGLASSAPDIRLDVPLFRQQRNGCGAASVAMVVHYWSRQLPELGLGGAQPAEVYEQLYSAEIGGIPMAAMKRYLEERGFHAFSVQASWEDLEDHLGKRRPVIVCLRKGPRSAMHYAVVVGLEGNRVWLNDPTRRKASAVKRSKFEKKWTSADRWLLLAVPRGR